LPEAENGGRDVALLSANFRHRTTPGLSHAGPATQEHLRLLGKLKAPIGVGSSDLVMNSFSQRVVS